jgi:hypothetical protein
MNKLKKHIISFVSIALSLVIVMTTSGFSVYVHHCNHNHANYYSLFVPSHNCNMHAPKTKVKSCCQTKEPAATPQCDESPNDNGCCTDKSQVVKLDTKTVLDNTIPTIKPIEIPSFIMLLAYSYRSFEINDTVVSIQQFSESPPPLTTSEYLSYIQVYII